MNAKRDDRFDAAAERLFGPGAKIEFSDPTRKEDGPPGLYRTDEHGFERYAGGLSNYDRRQYVRDADGWLHYFGPPEEDDLPRRDNPDATWRKSPMWRRVIDGEKGSTLAGGSLTDEERAAYSRDADGYLIPDTDPAATGEDGTPVVVCSGAPPEGLVDLLKAAVEHGRKDGEIA